MVHELPAKIVVTENDRKENVGVPRRYFSRRRCNLLFLNENMVFAAVNHVRECPLKREVLLQYETGAFGCFSPIMY